MFRDRFVGRFNARRQLRNRAARKPRPSSVEALESRQLLTTFYVDNNLLLTADRDASGGLSPGDQVTFGNGQSYQQADLTYDAAPTGGDVATAFSSISQALTSPLVQAGDTIDIAGATYTESGLTIDKSLTLQGDGSVVVTAPQASSETELSIIDKPATVTLMNLTLQNYGTALSDTGGGTLKLTDVNLPDGESSISNVENFEVVRNATTPEIVDIAPAVYAQAFTPQTTAAASTADNPPDSLSIRTNQSLLMNLTFSGVKNLSFQTGPGSRDTIDVGPLPDATVTIVGGNNAPQGSPGDTLNMPTNFFADSPLTATSDSSGISGTWSPTGYQSVNFSRMQALVPGIAPLNVSAIAGTQGTDTGSQVVAQFTDPAIDALAAGDKAEIYWQDDSSSAGTITYDSSTGVYSVLGSHTYAEGGSYTLSVNLNTPNGVVLLPKATANITATTAPQISVVQQWTLMATVGQSTSNMDIVTYRDSVHLPPSDYSAEIDWGDGATSSGSIPYDPGSWTFTVFGNHTYAQPGVDHIVVTILRNGGVAGTLTATADVNVAPPSHVIVGTPETLTATAGVPLPGAPGAHVAEFDDQQVDNSSFQATIDWGDGTTSTGTVVAVGDVLPPSVNRTFWQVYGTHTYAEAGTYSIDVELTEGGNIASTVTSTAIISGPPLTSNQQFVSHIYSDLLRRAVDQAGLTFWAGRLDGGLSRELLVLDLEATPEYHQDEVTSLYEHYLHRAAEPAALVADTQLLAQGMTDEQLAAMIASSDEYFALHGGTNEDFLAAIFQDALNRPIDADASAWFDQYLAAGATRADVAALIFSSHEYHADVVAGIYEQLLDRQPDARGQQYWAGQLDHGATDEQVIAVIAASDEYFGKGA